MDINIFNILFLQACRGGTVFEEFLSGHKNAARLHALPYNLKRALAQAIAAKMAHGYVGAFSYTHGDFMLQSMVGIIAARAIYEGDEKRLRFMADVSTEAGLKYNALFEEHAGWISKKPTSVGPLPLWMPASYIGGNMEYGRIFRINLTALWSPIERNGGCLGFRCDGGKGWWEPLKGLKEADMEDETWALYRPDFNATDDCTAMIYSPAEKEFDVEICRFNPGGQPDILLRYTCF